MRQLVLDLPIRSAYGRDDFLVAPCNQDAVAWLDRWPNWPTDMLVVHGPSGSGKSHLAQVWRKSSGARIIDANILSEAAASELPAGASVLIDDADQAVAQPGGPVALLHLVNFLRERGGNLLLTAKTPPVQWQLGLADLASRLTAAPTVGIKAPDDTLLKSLLVKHFHDRQVQVSGDVITYVLSRMERSFTAAQRLAASLDEAALAGKRPITVPLARRVLDKA